jgi:hypothetical protein
MQASLAEPSLLVGIKERKEKDDKRKERKYNKQDTLKVSCFNNNINNTLKGIV